MNLDSIDVGDRRRTYAHVRPTAPRDDVPLLLALHGTGQKGTTMRSFSGRTLDLLAERIGAELVYLDGRHRAWNDGRRTLVSRAQKEQADDVGFVRAVVERFARPTIAIGYSNGGQLLHRVLREEHGLLSGAAVIAAGLPVDDDFLLVDRAPDIVPVLLMHGTADPIVPYGGGETKLLGRSRGAVKSAADTALSYLAPGVDATPVVATEGEVERRNWPAVRLTTQSGTGHVIPNRRTSPARIVIGPSHRDLDTGEEIADFFGLA